MTSFKNLLWIAGVLQFSLTHAATVYLAGDSTMARQGGGKGVSDGRLLRLLTHQDETDVTIRLGRIFASLIVYPSCQPGDRRPICQEFYSRKTIRRYRQRSQAW